MILKLRNSFWTKIKFRTLKRKRGLKTKSLLRLKKDLRYYLRDPFKQAKGPLKVLRTYLRTYS